MQTISAETLRTWLDEGRPVSILDVRPDFVRVLLSRIPATPPNYDQIVMLNERGLLPEVPATELEAGANRCAVS